MSNSEQAKPGIDVVCKDRVRNFCLNLGAFQAIEDSEKQRLRGEGKEVEGYSVLDDFDFSDANTNLQTLILIVWAGFFTDAEEFDKDEPWTLDKAKAVVDFVGVSQIKGCIEESLRRVMTPEQFEKMQEEGEKKILMRRERKAAQAKSAA
jgi:hypothetical protein